MPYKDAEKRREAQHRHYVNNLDKFRNRRNARRDAINNLVNEIKSQGQCKQCGENFPACLDFHHIDPTQKLASIDRMKKAQWPLERVREELAKCELLCANCHRKLHYLSRWRYY